MPYKLQLSDFEYEIKENINNQMISLAAYVFPGSNWSGYITDYTRSEEKLYLFIDERDLNNGKAFFLGGVLLSQMEITQISNFIINFKKLFRPETNPEDWFIKGSGIWLDNQDISHYETEEEALTRWILWAKEIIKLRASYTIHSSTTLREKIQYTHRKRKKKKSEYYKITFESLLDTLMQHQYANITIVTDNIEGGQKKAFDEVLENYTGKINVEELLIIKKENFNSEFSNILQFVDMQIYAISRFIMPTDSGNILMGFEEFAREHSNKTIKDTMREKGNFYIHMMAAKNHIIAQLYHHLRHRISTGLHMLEFNDLESSSMVLNAKNTYIDFGSDVDKSIWHFITNVGSSKNFNIDKYN